MNLLNTAAVAERLGLSPKRVRELAAAGRLKGQRVGRDWVFDPRTVEAFAKVERKPGWKKGRPRKEGE